MNKLKNKYPKNVRLGHVWSGFYITEYAAEVIYDMMIIAALRSQKETKKVALRIAISLVTASAAILSL